MESKKKSEHKNDFNLHTSPVKFRLAWLCESAWDLWIKLNRLRHSCAQKRLLISVSHLYSKKEDDVLLLFYFACLWYQRLADSKWAKESYLELLRIITTNNNKDCDRKNIKLKCEIKCENKNTVMNLAPSKHLCNSLLSNEEEPWSNFYEFLGMKRATVKIVPKLQNFDQKQRRMDLAQEMLMTFNDDPHLLKKVIIGGESWL